MNGLEDIAAAFGTSPLFAKLAEIYHAGDYAKLESQAKRHHFVPQLLLREFCQEDDERRIYQLDVKSGQPKLVGITTAASRRGLYTAIEENGVKTSRIEGYLSLVESYARSALSQLVEDPLNLTDGDRATLSFFFAVQTQRTPVAARRIKQIANSTLQAHAGSMFSDKRAFERHYREEYGDDAREEDIEKLRQDVIAAVREGRVQLEDPGVAAFYEGLRYSAKLSFMIFDLEWTILNCRDSFITSDRAFAIHDPTPAFPWSAQAVMSSLNAQTTIPISPDSCLVMRPRDKRLDVRNVSREEAAMINLRTYGWTDRYVFGATQDTVVAVRREAKANPAAVEHPKPDCFVVLLDVDPEDDSFARANEARGWPPRLFHEGAPHDYVVVQTDQLNVELHKYLDETVMRRARKLYGVTEGEELEGHLATTPLSPFDLIQ